MSRILNMTCSYYVPCPILVNDSCGVYYGKFIHRTQVSVYAFRNYSYKLSNLVVTPPLKKNDILKNLHTTPTKKIHNKKQQQKTHIKNNRHTHFFRKKKNAKTSTPKILKFKILNPKKIPDNIRVVPTSPPLVVMKYYFPIL